MNKNNNGCLSGIVFIVLWIVALTYLGKAGAGALPFLLVLGFITYGQVKKWANQKKMDNSHRRQEQDRQRNWEQYSASTGLDNSADIAPLAIPEKLVEPDARKQAITRLVFALQQMAQKADSLASEQFTLAENNARDNIQRQGVKAFASVLQQVAVAQDVEKVQPTAADDAKLQLSAAVEKPVQSTEPASQEPTKKEDFWNTDVKDSFWDKKEGDDLWGI